MEEGPDETKSARRARHRREHVAKLQALADSATAAPSAVQAVAPVTMQSELAFQTEALNMVQQQTAFAIM